jgi:hypothetical protein
MDVKWLRDLRLRDLNYMFRSATEAAQKEAVVRGLPAYGLDDQGQLQEPKRSDLVYLTEKAAS